MFKKILKKERKCKTKINLCFFCCAYILDEFNSQCEYGKILEHGCIYLLILKGFFISDKCIIKCDHGTVEQETCTCDCQDGWFGRTCDGSTLAFL